MRKTNIILAVTAVSLFVLIVLGNVAASLWSVYSREFDGVFGTWQTENNDFQVEFVEDSYGNIYENAAVVTENDVKVLADFIFSGDTVIFYDIKTKNRLSYAYIDYGNDSFTLSMLGEKIFANDSYSLTQQ